MNATPPPINKCYDYLSLSFQICYKSLMSSKIISKLSLLKSFNFKRTQYYENYFFLLLYFNFKNKLRELSPHWRDNLEFIGEITTIQVRILLVIKFRHDVFCWWVYHHNLICQLCLLSLSTLLVAMRTQFSWENFNVAVLLSANSLDVSSACYWNSKYLSLN